MGPETVDIWFGSVSFFALTRTVRDTAAFLDATAGTLPGDPYTPPKPDGSWLAALATPPQPLKVGFTLTSPWGPAFAPEVTEAVRSTAALLEQLGHDVEEHPFTSDIETPWFEYNKMNAVQTVLDFDRLAEIVGRPVRKSDLSAFNWALLERGRSLPATDHAAAINAMRKANQQIQMELQPYDLFLTPTLTQPPRPVGYWDMTDPDVDRYNAKWTDAAFMFAFNVSGLPAMSVPGGMDQGRRADRRAVRRPLRGRGDDPAGRRASRGSPAVDPAAPRPLRDRVGRWRPPRTPFQARPLSDSRSATRSASDPARTGRP